MAKKGTLVEGAYRILPFFSGFLVLHQLLRILALVDPSGLSATAFQMVSFANFFGLTYYILFLILLGLFIQFQRNNDYRTSEGEVSPSLWTEILIPFGNYSFLNKNLEEIRKMHADNQSGDDKGVKGHIHNFLLTFKIQFLVWFLMGPVLFLTFKLDPGLIPFSFYSFIEIGNYLDLLLTIILMFFTIRMCLSIKDPMDPPEQGNFRKENKGMQMDYYS